MKERPADVPVDNKDTLTSIINALNRISEDTPIIFPIHPRTKKMLDTFDIKLSNQIHQMSPLGFSESLFLWKDAVCVFTDSGGLQEETTGLCIPCFTIREDTAPIINALIKTRPQSFSFAKASIITC